jgi:23S rRNA (uracil1939-C5)-methyltransferase
MAKRKLHSVEHSATDEISKRSDGQSGCSHRPPCPGCPQFGAPGLAPHVEATWRDWCAKLGVSDVAVVAGEALGYRHRVRLAVRGRASNPKFGLFELGTHQVVDIPQCVVHHPRLNEIARWLKQHVRQTRTPPYSDVHHAGLLRYVQLAVERKSERVQVVLVGNCEDETPLLPLFEALREAAPPSLHSLVFNGHPERSNVIFGKYWKLVRGEPYLVDESAGATVFYPPGAFSQANPRLFDRLAGEIHAWVEAGADVVEMYGGVGAIGLGLVSRAKQMVFNEISPPGLTGLKLGLDALRSEREGLPDVTIAQGDAKEALPHVTARSTVIVDPPRKGLDSAVLDGLGERRPRQIIYVSCGFPALQRDADELVRFGYRLRRARAFALFPFTEHVETLAEFIVE